MRSTPIPNETISHPGVIASVSDKGVNVRIESAAACGSCKVKSACGMSEMEDKIVEVTPDPQKQYTIGEPVTIYMRESHGPLAVFFGYILPFVVVLISLIVMLELGFGEGISGLASLGFLVPYYFTLYLLRDRLRKKFRFFIR